MNLYENLARLRKTHGLTQEAVAQAMHVHVRAYQNYERGDRVPPLLNLIAAADLYGLALDDLVGRIPPKKNGENGESGEESRTYAEEKAFR